MLLYGSRMSSDEILDLIAAVVFFLISIYEGSNPTRLASCICSSPFMIDGVSGFRFTCALINSTI